MSLSSLLSERTRLEQEIASFNKKIAYYTKKSTDAMKKICSVRSSIKPSISQSLISSKLQKIKNYERDKVEADAKIAEYLRKVARLREKLASKDQQIQKMQIEGYMEAQKSLQKVHQDSINGLEKQFLRSFATSRIKFFYLFYTQIYINIIIIRKNKTSIFDESILGKHFPLSAA